MIEKWYPPKRPGLNKRPCSLIQLIRLCCVCCCTSLLLAGAGGAQTFFTEVTEEVGLQGILDEKEARGIVVFDYDNDGFQDLFVTENGRWDRRIGLFHNTGDGHFVDQTALIPTHFRITDGFSGSVSGDYDNDGDEDLFLAVSPRNTLLRNDRGTFVAVGLDSNSLGTDGAIWLDYNQDGYLDIYATNRKDTPPLISGTNRLFRNNGDGTFSDQTAAASLDIEFQPLFGGSDGGPVAGDFNGDGWPDLYLGVNDRPNRLFLNDGQGRFIDATHGEIADEGAAFSVSVGDIDNDGDLDLFQPAGSSPATGFRSLMLLNLGDAQFLDATEGLGLGLEVLGTNAAGSAFADFDNDGDLDLFIGISGRISNGEPIFCNLLLLNDGSGFFTEATASLGIEDFAPYVAIADYDEDGLVDILISSTSRENISRGRVALYRNNGLSQTADAVARHNHHWLRIELVGIESNRSAIGARLFATAGDLQQMREILGGLGRSQDEKVAHFGLGEHTQVDRLEIRWPSGQVDVLADIPADQKIRVFEGRTTFGSARPTTWDHNLPRRATAGKTFQLNTSVHITRFDPAGEILSVVADLSTLGGPNEVPLQRSAEGAYQLSTAWRVEAAGGILHPVALLIEQSTALGPHWTRLVHNVSVYPTSDLILLDEEDLHTLSLEGIDGVLAIDRGQRQHVFNGAVATSFQVDPDRRIWSIAMYSKHPIELAGFHSLAFALHPGDARGRPVDQLSIKINRSPAVDLLDVHIDMDAETWQTVLIPLEELALDGPIFQIVVAGNLTGTFYLDDLRLIAAEPPTAVGETHDSRQPQDFALLQNFPNPFNNSTVIRFALPQSQDIALSVYNLAGQKVATLLQGQRPAGNYAIHWDGRDDQERELASGVYLYRLQVGGKEAETRKLALVR